MAPLSIVIGPATHGKSTLRGMLCEELDAKGGSCSDYIYALWAYLDGKRSVEVLRQMPKEEARQRLVALGDWLTTSSPTFCAQFPFHMFPGYDPSVLDRTGLPKPNPGALIQGAFNDGVRVLDGVRRRRELEAALPFFAWFGVKPFIIWVEDPRKARNPEDNLDLGPQDAEMRVYNGGDLEQLRRTAREIAKEIRRRSDLDA